MFKYEVQAKGTDEDATISHYVYVKKDLEDQYWDFDDGMFKGFGQLVQGTQPLTENSVQPGLWQASLDMSDFTGGIKVIPRNSSTNVISGDVESYFLLDGELPLKDERQKKMLDTHSGGIDNLRYEDADGNPIEGAAIRVFEETEYESGNINNAIGITFTNKNGRWINPIPVSVGVDYIVHFFKEDEHGPQTISITVY